MLHDGNIIVTGSVTTPSIVPTTGGGLKTGTTNTNTALLQAYDVDGTAYTTFGTLTAGNTPTFDLADAVTKGGSYIYRAGGTDVGIADGGTGISTVPTTGQVLVGKSASGGYVPVTRTGPYTENLIIVRDSATTIKITGVGGTALSGSNPGFVYLLSTASAGNVIPFEVTADVTITLTDCYWPGNLVTQTVTGMLLRVLAVNNNGTLIWGIAFLGGRHTLYTVDSKTVANTVDNPEAVYLTSALNASNTCREIGFFRTDWSIVAASFGTFSNQTGINDFVTGESCDGFWQPWNPVWAGVSVQPVTNGVYQWRQVGRTIYVTTGLMSNAASSTTSLAFSAPAKGRRTDFGLGGCAITNNNITTNNIGLVQITGGTNTINIYVDSTGNSWTNAGSKAATVSNFAYEVGPSASFIE